MTSTTDEQRAVLGPALGRDAQRLGGRRGRADADLRDGDRAPGHRRRASWCSTSAAAPAPSCARPPTAARRSPASTPPRACWRSRASACRRPSCSPATCRSCRSATTAFDVVTGFSSLFFADDMTRALSEARRVCKPGGTVLAQVFGRPERCSLEVMKRAIMPLLRTRRRRAAVLALRHARADRARRRADAARVLLLVVGVRVRRRGVRCCARCSRRAAPSPPSSTPAATSSSRRSSARSPRTATRDGSYRLPNEWHYLVARA